MFRRHGNIPASPAVAAERGTACLVALVVLLAAHFAITLWWFGQDNHPIWGDEESHLLQARAYYAALTAPNTGLLERMHKAAVLPPPYPVHPPLTHLAGACFAILFGYGVHQMAAVSMLAFLLLLLGTWRLARSFLAPARALFAVAVVSLTPGLFVSSRYFMTDYPLAALVVWLMALAVRGEVFLRPGRAGVFGMLAGLAILSRTIAPVYFLVPALLTFFHDAFACRRSPERKTGRMVSRLLGCGVLSVVVAAAIAAPWHVYNRAAFENFWFHQHSGTGGRPIALWESGGGAPGQPQTAPVAGPSAAGPARTPAPEVGGWQRLVRPVLHPAVSWSAYPVHVVNNGLFLPLALLSLAGMIMIVLRPRQRPFGEWLLVVWVVSGWVMLTLVFTIATPRYTLPFQAGLSLLAALAVLGIPRRPLRRCCGALLIGLLLFGHANLTLARTGAWMARLYAPCHPAEEILEKYDDSGLCIYKNRLTLGEAYTWLGAPEKENYRDRIYAAMTGSEHEAALPRGGEALFGVVNMRGLEFDATHYWPGSPERPNRLFNRDTPESLRLPRPLSLCARTTDAEDLTAMSDTLDYVVCAADTSTRGRLNAWTAWMDAHEFRLLDRFVQARRATVPARTFLVYGKKTPNALAKLQKPEETGGLDRLELLRVLNHLPRGKDAGEPVLAAARSALDGIMKAFPARGTLNEGMVLHDITLKNDVDGWTTCRLIVRVAQPLRCDCRMYFRGFVQKNGQDAGVADYGETPLPPAADWFPGEYAMMAVRFPTTVVPDVLEVRSQWQLPGARPTMARIDLTRLTGGNGS